VPRLTRHTCAASSAWTISVRPRAARHEETWERWRGLAAAPGRAGHERRARRPRLESYPEMPADVCHVQISLADRGHRGGKNSVPPARRASWQRTRRSPARHPRRPSKRHTPPLRVRARMGTPSRQVTAWRTRSARLGPDRAVATQSTAHPQGWITSSASVCRASGAAESVAVAVVPFVEHVGLAPRQVPTNATRSFHISPVLLSVIRRCTGPPERIN
jgi:hypothetical protein